MIAGLIIGLALLIAALWLFGTFDDNRIVRAIRFVIVLSQEFITFAMPYMVLYIALKVSQ